MDKHSKSLTLALFAFGILFSVLGWLTVDKLNSINDSLKEVRTELKEVRLESNSQDKRIQTLEDFNKLSKEHK